MIRGRGGGLCVPHVLLQQDASVEGHLLVLLRHQIRAVHLEQPDNDEGPDAQRKQDLQDHLGVGHDDCGLLFMAGISVCSAGGAEMRKER